MAQMPAARDSLKGTSEHCKGDSIVEGWGGDEDEDVNIDSDEKDSACARDDELRSVPTGGSSSQLPGSGLGGRLELRIGLSAGNELPLSRTGKVFKSSNVASLGSVPNGNDFGLCTSRGQLRVSADLDSGRADNKTVAAESNLVRVDFTSGGYNTEVPTKRLDARRFRKEFSAAITESNIPVSSKSPVADVGRMRGSIKNDVNEYKKSSQGGVGQGGKLKNNAATQLYTRSLPTQRAEILAGENYGRGKKGLQNERGRQNDRLWRLKVQDVRETGTHLGKDITRKRRYEKVEHKQQTAERKSTLRGRTEMSKQNEVKLRKQSGGDRENSDLPLKTKRAKEDEDLRLVRVSGQDNDNVNQDYSGPQQKKKRTRREEVGCSIGASQQREDSSRRGGTQGKRSKKDEDTSPVNSLVKWTPPKRGAHSASKLPAKQLRESGCMKSAGNEGKDESHVEGQPSVRKDKLLHCLQVADCKGMDVRVSPEQLGKVFDRRPTVSEERGKGNISVLQIVRADAAVGAESIDNVSRTVGTEFQENEKLIPCGRRPTRSSDKPHADNKCRQSTKVVFETLRKKQLCEEGDVAKVFQRRPTRSSVKVKIDSPVRVETLEKTFSPQKRETVISELGNNFLITSEGMTCLSEERREVLFATEETVNLPEEKECILYTHCKINVWEEFPEDMVTSGVEEQDFLIQETTESNKEKLDWGKCKVFSEDLSGKELNLDQAETMNNRRVELNVEIGPGVNLGSKECTNEMCRSEQLKNQVLCIGRQHDLQIFERSRALSATLTHLDRVWHPRSPISQTVKLASLEAGNCQFGASSGPNVCADMRTSASRDGILSKQQFLQSLEKGEKGSKGSDSKEVVDAKFLGTEDLPGNALKDARQSSSGKRAHNEENRDKVASSSMGDNSLECNKPDHSKLQPLGIDDQELADAVPKALGIYALDGMVTLETKEDIPVEIHGDSSAYPQLPFQTDSERMELVISIGKGQTRKEEQCSKYSTYSIAPCNLIDPVNSLNDGNDRLGLIEENRRFITKEEYCLEESLATHPEIIEERQGAVSKLSVKQGRLTSGVLVDCDLTGQEGSDSEDGVLNDHHNSFCESCRHGGELICCDGSGCRVTYHLECTDPKLVEVPSGNWYCPACAQKRLSYGVHAVSKLVESIWDVRNSGQGVTGCHDSSSICPKNVSCLSSDAFSYEDDGKSGRLLNDHPGKDRRDGREKESLAAVNAAFNDEGIHGVYEDCIVSSVLCPLRANRRSDTELHGRAQTEQNRLDGGGKFLEMNSMIEVQVAMESLPCSVKGVHVWDESKEKEYFVKWRGISHVHNTWVAEKELTKISPKVLAKFKKKQNEGQAPKWNAEWAEPQRLVDRRLSILPRRLGGGRGLLGNDSKEEWLVKWKGMGYEHCTWEPILSGILSDPRAKELEVIFDSWCESSRKRIDPVRVEEVLPKTFQVKRLCEACFKNLDSHPEWLQGGELLAYQLDRLNILRQRWHHHQNTVICNEDDQDKLSSVVPLLLSLTEEYQIHRPILVIVPLFEIQSWEAEVSRNAAHVNIVVYTGVKEARGVIQRFELNRSDRPLRVQILLTTYEVASSDFEYLNTFKWEAVVVDEGQHSKITKSHRTFLLFDARFRLLLVNDLCKYNVEELQHILSFVAPQNSASNLDVRQILADLDELEQVQYLRDQLNEYVVMDSKPDVTCGLELRECWVGAQMTLIQVYLYCNTLTKHYNLLHSGRLRMDPDSPSLHEFMTQLRLCCQHPYHVDPTLQESIKQDLALSESLVDAGIEVSGKLQLLDIMLCVLHAGGHRVLVLSQFLLQLYLLDDYMRQKYGLDSYEMADTRHSALKKNKAVQRFNAKDSSRFVFLLRTGASGLSLKLRAMDAVIIHDSDLNPANDLEYVRRVLHKVDGELKVYRLYHHSSVEEGLMVYAHQKKLEPDTKSLTSKFLQQVLRWKVQNLLQIDATSSIKATLQKMKQMNLLNESRMPELEHVRNILQGTVSMEAVAETLRDEVLAEEDGDSVKEFWSLLLKDRYAELQDREEQLNMGKGLRQRKKVQYSEEALALAPYSGFEEVKRRRRKPQVFEAGSSSGPRDKSRQNSLQSSPSTPRLAESQSEEHVHGNELFSRAIPEVNNRERREVGTVGTTMGSKADSTVCTSVVETAVSAQIQNGQGLVPVALDQIPNAVGQVSELFRANRSSNEALGSSGSCKVKNEESGLHSAPNLVNPRSPMKPASIGNVSPTTALQVDSGRRLRMEQKQQLLRMEPELSQICKILQVPENIASYSQRLLCHVMNSFRMPKEPRELVVLVEISLCLVAAAHFVQALEHLPAVCEVGEKMELSLKKEEFESVYSRLEGMCKTHSTFPSAKLGAETVLAVAEDESCVHAMPTSEASKNYSVAQDWSLAEARRLSGEPVLDKLAVPGNLHLCQQDKLSNPYLEEQPTPAQTVSRQLPQETCLQPSDIVLSTQSDLQRSLSHLDDEDSGDCHIVEESISGALQKAQPPRSQTEEEICTKLKLDRDQILQSCLVKQKSEVAELYRSRRKNRAVCQMKSEEQRSSIKGMNCDHVQKTEMLRLQADTFASDLKMYDQETEEQLSDMNNEQRLVRDKVNALYTRLLKEVSPVAVPDFVTEAQGIGLTFLTQNPPPKQQGSVLAWQMGHPGVQKNQQIQSESWSQPPLSLYHQCQISALSQHQSVPQLPPEVQLLVQPQNVSQPILQLESRQVPQSESHHQHWPLDLPSSVQLGAHCQSTSQTIYTYNFETQLSAPQEQTGIQLEYLHLQRCLTSPHQPTMEIQERVSASSTQRPTPLSSHNILGSELVPGVVPHYLGRTQTACEQWTAQSLTALQPWTSQTTQLSIDFQSIVPQSRIPQESILSLQQSPSNAANLYQTLPIGRGQQQRVGDQEIFLPSGGLAVAPTNHARSNVALQTILSRARGRSSPNKLGPDPLVHEENRLRREQEMVKTMFDEETAQIKSQYERDSEEMRKKYEGLLQDRHRTMEQKANALKENLEKVDRNRRLAEALKYRAYLDLPKIHTIPTDSTEGSAGGGQVARALLHMPSSQQTMATAAIHNARRNTGLGSCNSVSPFIPGNITSASGSRPLPSASSTDGLIMTTQAGLWLGSSVAPVSRQSNTHSAISMSFDVGLPTAREHSGMLANCLSGDIARVSSTMAAELNSSLSPQPGASLQNAEFRPHQTNLSPYQSTSFSITQTSVKQRRSWTTAWEGSSGLVVPLPAATLEHLNQANSPFLGAPLLSRSRNHGVYPPIVTEAILVSESPILSADIIENLELSGNESIHRSRRDMVTEYSSMQTLDVEVVIPAAVANLETVGGALSDTEGGRVAPDSGHNSSISQLPSTGCPVPPEPDLIYISDDD